MVHISIYPVGRHSRTVRYLLDCRDRPPSHHARRCALLSRSVSWSNVLYSSLRHSRSLSRRTSSSCGRDPPRLPFRYHCVPPRPVYNVPLAQCGIVFAIHRNGYVGVGRARHPAGSKVGAIPALSLWLVGRFGGCLRGRSVSKARAERPCGPATRSWGDGSRIGRFLPLELRRHRALRDSCRTATVTSGFTPHDSGPMQGLPPCSISARP